MNVRHTEREDKCADRLVKLVKRVLVALRPRNSNQSILVSTFAYWGMTQWFYFSSFGVDALQYIFKLDSHINAAYYFINSLFPIGSILIIFTACYINLEPPSKLEKITVFVLALLVLDNVVMGIDAIVNLEPWPALNEIDVFIQGNPEWIIPIGASDWILIGICLVCLTSYLRGSDCV